MKKLLLIALLFCYSLTKAQFVTIPDAKFVIWLQTNASSAMTGNQMDTTDGSLSSFTAINVSNDSIADLTGIQYFKSLNSLTCDHNQLTTLPNLPLSLNILYCQNNQLNSLPYLPPTLAALSCYANQLTSLPAFPPSLTDVDCNNNQLTALPALNPQLSSLSCSNNSLTAMPQLPNTLTYLDCSFNQLTALPAFPSSLASLYCQNNQISSFPPYIPAGLQSIEAHDNNISCFPFFPTGMSYLTINNNPFTCLPNYVSAMDAATLAFPLCAAGNANGCPLGLQPNCVIIPDANFAAYLQSVIPAAMNGSQMDTTNPAVTMLTDIIVENDSIGDLTGLQYFDSLKTLDCGNGLSAPHPNYLTALPKLPSTLTNLICGNNKITSLPTLPDSLFDLGCYGNQLTSLPALPSTLLYLNCYYNQITSLPALPDSLQQLACYGNQLTSLPTLPNNHTLIWLFCQYNSLTSLPALPNSITALDCSFNPITSLPTLPSSINQLSAAGCQLTNLPTLPLILFDLGVGNNQLTSIPALSDSLQQFACQNNLLTSLPPLPNKLFYLDCSNNNIACFQHFPDSLVVPTSCIINNNPFNCLPNYVPAMDAATLTYPLCTPGNTNGCPNAQGIVGFIYKDINADCIKNTGDSSLKNIALKIYDNSNNLLGQTYSAQNGVYNFPQTAGTYSVVVDTTSSAFMVQCAHPGLDSVVTVSSLDTNINFALTCKSGFDVGVQAVATNGLVFPGQQHTLYTIAGDLSQWYNLNCAAGVSGQVQITITGPVTYVSPTTNALTPSIAGNVYTYAITDFSTVNIATAFNLIFSTNTNAQAGDTVCVNVNVTPATGDNNPGNNNYSTCYQVVNSHDPNQKETYPINVAPAYNNWFTYTIHFQNTGSAQAININLQDTLDANLDISTFQLINYSHKNTTTLNQNLLAFSFHNINLTDSTSNKAGSMGFVQYRIKPKANLPAGTQIKNTGYIYFDYNAAVVTNTSLNNFNAPSGINQFTNNIIKIYPNPANNKITVDANDVLDVKLFDVLGNQITGTTQNKIDVSNLTNGVYFIQVQTKQNSYTQKIIIQH